jgi:hypothetical protein
MDRLAYSIDDAATAVGYSADTIRREVDKGNLSVRYANRKPIILRSELEAWLESLPSERPGR